MNQLSYENNLPFPLYCFHTGGELEGARALLDSTDANGREWNLNFVWSTSRFSEQFGGISEHPRYYLINPEGEPCAVFNNHPENTLETLVWLKEQVETRRRP
ncbi:MAG: hypothetical protein IPK53_00985 [bacterium]|nr:hypothetical protein [bacterium]